MIASLLAKTTLLRRIPRWAALIFSIALADVPAARAQSPAEPQASAAAAEPTMLRLFDGSILWGGIVGDDAETLHFERLDNGGRLYVPWSRLDPALADELLEKFG